MKTLLLLLLWLSTPLLTLAQGLNLAAEDPNKPVELPLDADPDLPKGKVAVRQAEADATGHRYLVRGLGIMQPVTVTVFAQKPGTVVRAELYQENWQHAERSEISSDSGRVRLRFRTEGDLGLWVKAEGPEPVPYYLVVWAGDELRPDVPSAFVPTPVADMQPGGPAEVAAAGGLGTTTWLTIVAGLLVVIGGLLVAMLRGQRPGRTGAAVLLLMTLSAAPATADPLTPVPLRQAAEAWVREYRPELSGAVVEAAAGQAGQSVLAGFGGVYLSTREALSAYEALTGRDRSLQPDFNPSGTPRVPSACAGRAACSSCYARAQADLNRIRIVLEKLRLRGKATKEYTDKSIALGDATASAVPGSVAGLAWVQQKKGIQDDFKNFEAAYDRKHRELVGNLQEYLRALSRCEAAAGVPDWYDRYGFVYFQFMEAHYKRSW